MGSFTSNHQDHQDHQESVALDGRVRYSRKYSTVQESCADASLRSFRRMALH